MYDLSLVTDTLRDILTDALATSPLFGGGGPVFSVSVSGQHPDGIATGADCDLNLYLFHVAEDRNLRNQFWSQQSISGQPPGPARQPVAFEPMALNLFFLLSAQSATSYVQEQQVMSIAIRAFHEHATVMLPVPTPTGVPQSQITLNMDTPTPDELSRLWQALNQPLRMTAQYRASVALLTPETGATAQPNPTTWTLLGNPVGGSPATMPMLFGTIRRVAFVGPAGARTYDQTPASAAPAPPAATGQTFVLRGRGIADTDQVLLVAWDAAGVETETDVTTWKVPLTTPYPSPPGDGVPIALKPPQAAGVAPGRYGLRLARPAEPGWRSNTAPFMVAPWLDPSGGPLLTAGGGGIYTATARNIPATGAELRLGSVLLARTGAAPSAGQWRFAGTTLTFAAPTGMPSGDHAIRLRAANVESDPALWAVVP